MYGFYCSAVQLVAERYGLYDLTIKTNKPLPDCVKTCNNDGVVAFVTYNKNTKQHSHSWLITIDQATDENISVMFKYMDENYDASYNVAKEEIQRRWN